MDELNADKWIKKAEEDLDIASYLLKGGRINGVAFHTQQAGEKALKALYIKKFNKLWKIHNLVELAKEIDAPLEILEICSDLNPAYITSRYEVDENYKKDEVSHLVDCAKVLIKWVKEKLQQ